MDSSQSRLEAIKAKEEKIEKIVSAIDTNREKFNAKELDEESYISKQGALERELRSVLDGSDDAAGAAAAGHVVHHDYREPPPVEVFAGAQPKSASAETFVWNRGGRHVFLVGSFTICEWDDRIPLLPDRDYYGTMKRVVLLPPGRHKFKFVVDGEWRIDEGQPMLTDKAGNINNVRVVKAPDTEENPPELDDVQPLPGLDIDDARQRADEYIRERSVGQARPLGCTLLRSLKAKGNEYLSLNFAIHTDERVTALSLLLYLVNPEETCDVDAEQLLASPATSLVAHSWPDYALSLNPRLNRTPEDSDAGGFTWRVQLDNIMVPAGKKLLYAYGVNTFHHPVLDPYARLIDSPAAAAWGKKRLVAAAGVRMHPYVVPRCYTVPADAAFDWEGVPAPGRTMRELVIYEMHVRGFTIHSSSRLSNPDHRGTFLGIIEKIPHLVALGVTAVELLPMFEFDETDCSKMNPVTLEPLYNYWGYGSESFFAPMGRYGVKRGAALDEFKLMVRELHRAKIEVILDVVYNHASGPAFDSLARTHYFILSEHGMHCNYTGCGNTMACNQPITTEMVLDSMRYWALEMQVDGFRFDIATILGRGADGRPMDDPPCIRQMFEVFSMEPALKSKKLIMEPWDADHLIKIGSFWYGSRFSEWNAYFRDQVRDYIKGTAGNQHIATRLAGSADLYQSHLAGTVKHRDSPLFSVNFITAHDGFTLRDLVTYNVKHNEGNAENNTDGLNENISWNCGAEGPTEDLAIVRLRMQQMKNFHVALMVARGIPMVHMGDEYMHTRAGNNNPYNQDNELNWFLWDELDDIRGRKTDFFHFFSGMIHLRRRYALLTADSFFSEVKWHAPDAALPPEWGRHSKFLAFSLWDVAARYALYVAFNPSHLPLQVTLPTLETVPELFEAAGVEASGSLVWKRLVDTAFMAPYDLVDEERADPLLGPPFRYDLDLYSSALFLATW